MKLKADEIERLFKCTECEINVIEQTIKAGNDAYKFELDPLKKEFILQGGFLKFMDSKVPKVKEWEKQNS